jgi:hypothetical protein
VFPLGLGGNTFGWTSDKDTSFSVLDAYVAGGGNFIDTADSYSAWVPGHAGGESETIIGEWTAARGNRDSVIIATKVFSHPQFRGLSPKNVLAAADASLARLQTDRIDLYYAHRDDPDVPVAEAAGAFHELQVAGKIRYVGLSNYTAPRLREWLAVAAAGDEPVENGEGRLLVGCPPERVAAEPEREHVKVRFSDNRHRAASTFDRYVHPPQQRHERLCSGPGSLLACGDHFPESGHQCRRVPVASVAAAAPVPICSAPAAAP